jgi:hypothetical protein
MCRFVWGFLLVGVSPVASSAADIPAREAVQNKEGAAASQQTPQAPIAEPAAGTRATQEIPQAAPGPQAGAQVEQVEQIEESAAAPATEAGSWFGDDWPVLERLVDQQTARTVRPRTFNSIINHRNFEPIGTAPFAHLLGFDAGALKVGLGIRYGIMEHWDAAVYRQSFATDPFSTWEFDTRYQFLTQQEHKIDLAVRAGFTWFESQRQGVGQTFGGFGELMATRIVADRLLLNVGLLFHSKSNGYNKYLVPDATSYSGAVLAGAEIRIFEWLAWNVEVDSSVLGYGQGYPVIVTGPRFYTNRHSFSLVVANSQYSSSDSIVSNTQNIAPDTWIFGFNITREVGL